MAARLVSRPGQSVAVAVALRAQMPPAAPSRAATRGPASGAPAMGRRWPSISATALYGDVAQGTSSRPGIRRTGLAMVNAAWHTLRWFSAQRQTDHPVGELGRELRRRPRAVRRRQLHQVEANDAPPPRHLGQEVGHGVPIEAARLRRTDGG